MNNMLRQSSIILSHRCMHGYGRLSKTIFQDCSPTLTSRRSIFSWGKLPLDQFDELLDGQKAEHNSQPKSAWSTQRTRIQTIMNNLKGYLRDANFLFFASEVVEIEPIYRPAGLSRDNLQCIILFLNRRMRSTVWKPNDVKMLANVFRTGPSTPLEEFDPLLARVYVQDLANDKINAWSLMGPNLSPQVYGRLFTEWAVIMLHTDAFYHNIRTNLAFVLLHIAVEFENLEAAAWILQLQSLPEWSNNISAYRILIRAAMPMPGPDRAFALLDKHVADADCPWQVKSAWASHLLNSLPDRLRIPDEVQRCAKILSDSMKKDIVPGSSGPENTDTIDFKNERSFEHPALLLLKTINRPLRGIAEVVDQLSEEELSNVREQLKTTMAGFDGYHASAVKSLLKHNHPHGSFIYAVELGLKHNGWGTRKWKDHMFRAALVPNPHARWMCCLIAWDAQGLWKVFSGDKRPQPATSPPGREASDNICEYAANTLTDKALATQTPRLCLDRTMTVAGLARLSGNYQLGLEILEQSRRILQQYSPMSASAEQIEIEIALYTLKKSELLEGWTPNSWQKTYEKTCSKENALNRAQDYLEKNIL